MNSFVVQMIVLHYLWQIRWYKYVVRCIIFIGSWIVEKIELARGLECHSEMNNDYDARLWRIVWQIPLKILHPRHPPDWKTEITQWKSKFDRMFSLNLYREIPWNLSFSIRRILKEQHYQWKLSYKNNFKRRALFLIVYRKSSCELTFENDCAR